jgi:glycosyltransferase involved in cell wall biosynthesis
MPTLLLEGPFETDYSLAIVNRGLARAIVQKQIPVRLHQRDNTTAYFPAEAFLREEPTLAALFVRDVKSCSADIHSRNIYPPYTDGFRGALRVMHSYGWEESGFPGEFVRYFNDGLDLVTTVSGYVRDVLRQNGVRVPIELVGNGADHILKAEAKPVALLRAGTFDFLHASSCFPRKAPETLVRAFCAEFTRRDDVRLIIKTFPNPHNEIERIVREIGQEYPEHAPIEVLTESLDSGQMRYLYEHAGCLVSASRGEGFGLPVAEAMFTGCPVIATMHSGQADLCRPEHCWPVEYVLEQARTHLTEGTSLWADPRLESLREQMRAVYRATALERLRKTDAARQFVTERFTWARVADRYWDICQAALEERSAVHKRAAAPKIAGDGPAIGFVTTWNTRCGIAEYTRYLATSLPAGHRVAVFANRTPGLARPDEAFVTRCWDMRHDDTRRPGELDEMIRLILESGVQAVSIQYNFGFFSPSDLTRLTERLKQEGLVTTITMHAIQHANFPRLKRALESVDFCICHKQADVDEVAGLGVKNVLLRKQGIVPFQLDRRSSRNNVRRSLHFTVSCFGFFLPPKGIYQLIQAFALAKRVQPLLRLKLLNSLYPDPASDAYARQCLQLIEDKCLGGDVEVSTAFLDPEETLAELAASDLLVLPYLYSTESSSAAGAFAIASLAPVLCSDLPLFDELGPVVHRFPSGDVIALANKVLQLAGNPTELNRYRETQEALVRKLAWPEIARDFAGLIEARRNGAAAIAAS